MVISRYDRERSLSWRGGSVICAIRVLSDLPDGIVIDIGGDCIKRVMRFSQQLEASMYAGPG